MTLLIVGANSQYAITAADTRLSANGVLVDDLSPKIASLQFFDAKLLSSYTGLSQVPGFNTREWLLETLPSVAKPWVKADEALSALRTQVTAEFNSHRALNRLGPMHKRLSLAFAGWVEGEVRGALISNFEDHKGDFPKVSDDFVLTRWTSKRRDATFVYVLGAKQAIALSDVLELQDILRDRAGDPRAFKGKAQSLILRAAKDSRSKQLIGSNILTGMLLRNGASSSWFSSEGGGDKLLALDGFNALGGTSIMNLSLQGAEIVSPRSKRRGRAGKFEP